MLESLLSLLTVPLHRLGRLDGFVAVRRSTGTGEPLP